MGSAGSNARSAGRGLRRTSPSAWGSGCVTGSRPSSWRRTTATTAAATSWRPTASRRPPSESNRTGAFGVFSGVRTFFSVVSGEGRGPSGARGMGLLGTTVTVVAGISVLTPAGAAALGAGPNLSDLSCAVPPLPHGVATSSSRPGMLAGPAVSALTGGAARHGFALDGRDLVVDPPRPHDVPAVTADQAICGAMASTAGLSGDVQQGAA